MNYFHLIRKQCKQLERICSIFVHTKRENTMRFLKAISANRKTEVANLFNDFKADYSDETRTFGMTGANIFTIEGAEKTATHAVASCRCGWCAILPAESDYENCPECGTGWAN